MTAETTEATTAGATTADLFEQLEVDARASARTLENAGKLTGGFTDHFYPLTRREEAAGRRARACWLLATDLDSLRALLAGQRVPRHRLNQRYLNMHTERTR